MRISAKLACCLFFALPASAHWMVAAERPTMKVTRDPRPDILAHPLYDSYTEYRRRYNRPRFVSGWVASKIAPSSQEAMVWRENYAAGRYDRKHMPPMFKRYYAPKPWEVLLTGPRADFAEPPQALPPSAAPEPIEAADQTPGASRTGQ